MSKNDLKDRARNDFVYHPGTDETAPLYEANRSVLLNAAFDIIDRCPEGRELSLALTHLEESMFWANAAIARKEPA